MAQILQKLYNIKNGKSITLRSAQLQDAENLSLFFDKVYKTSLFVLTEPDENDKTTEKLKVEISESLTQNGFLCMVAEFEERIVGHLHFKNNHRFRRISHRGRFDISIGETWRNNGLGRAMVGELIAWASRPSAPVTKIELVALEVNTSAIALYESLGFFREGRFSNEVCLANGQYADGISMGMFVKQPLDFEASSTHRI